MSERPDRATGTAREWLRYAEEDLGVAERESARGTGAYHTICFLCQAAAEKLLSEAFSAENASCPSSSSEHSLASARSGPLEHVNPDNNIPHASQLSIAMLHPQSLDCPS